VFKKSSTNSLQKQAVLAVMRPPKERKGYKKKKTNKNNHDIVDIHIGSNHKKSESSQAHKSMDKANISKTL
jgi:hypothetical protein